MFVRNSQFCDMCLTNLKKKTEPEKMVKEIFLNSGPDVRTQVPVTPYISK